MARVTFENLGYLTTQELWRLMAHLKIPYCNIEDTEKQLENEIIFKTDKKIEVKNIEIFRK